MNNKSLEEKGRTASVITAGIAGLAGGATLGAFGGPIGMLVGSLTGALITGYAESARGGNSAGYYPGRNSGIRPTPSAPKGRTRSKSKGLPRFFREKTMLK